MQRSRFSDQQIALALEQVAHGMPVADPFREQGISEKAFYR